MLVLLSTDPRQAARLRSALPAAEPVVTVSGWEELEQATPAATCSVIYVEELRSRSAIQQLCALKARFPYHPTVLVTRWDFENVRHLTDVSVNEVVWLREVDDALRGAVARACCGSPAPVDRVGLPAAEDCRLPPRVRDAVLYACRSAPPVRSVNELARAVQCDRRTLWLQWHRAVGGAPLRLQDFLHWLILVQAVERKRPEVTWISTADELRVSVQALWRYARRLTGRTLRDLEGEEEEVRRRFHQQVVEILLDTRSSDRS